MYILITVSFNWTAQPTNPTQAIKGQDVLLTWYYSLTADEQPSTHYGIFWSMLNQSSSDYYQIGKKYFIQHFGTLYDEPRAPPIVVDKSDPATLHVNDVRKEDEGKYRI